MQYNRKGKKETWLSGKWSKGKANCPKEPPEEGEIISVKLDGDRYAIAIGNGKDDVSLCPAIELTKTLGEL